MHFFRKSCGKDVYDLKELIWTKPVHTISNRIPFPTFNENSHESFFNYLSNFTFYNIVELVTEENFVPFNYKDDVAKFNSLKQKHQLENNSFEEMFLSELGGYLETFEKSFRNVMADMYSMDTGLSPSEEEFASLSPKVLRNLIYHAIKSKKLVRELPTFQILPFSHLTKCSLRIPGMHGSCISHNRYL